MSNSMSTAHRCEPLLDEYDFVAPSAVFASSSLRALPWNDGPVTRQRQAQPSPASHGDGPLSYRSMASPRAPHSKSTAAFASGSSRFTKVRKASEATPVVSQAPFDSDAMGEHTTLQAYAELRGGWHGGRPSAAFVSSAKRLTTPQTISPGPGAYMKADMKASASAGELASGRCAAFASASLRRLPFESGGGRGTDLQVPAPSAYTPAQLEPRLGLALKSAELGCCRARAVLAAPLPPQWPRPS